MKVLFTKRTDFAINHWLFGLLLAVYFFHLKADVFSWKLYILVIIFMWAKRYAICYKLFSWWVRHFCLFPINFLEQKLRKKINLLNMKSMHKSHLFESSLYKCISLLLRWIFVLKLNLIEMNYFHIELYSLVNVLEYSHSNTLSDIAIWFSVEIEKRLWKPFKNVICRNFPHYVSIASSNNCPQVDHIVVSINELQYVAKWVLIGNLTVLTKLCPSNAIRLHIKIPDLLREYKLLTLFLYISPGKIVKNANSWTLLPAVGFDSPFFQQSL